MKMGYTVALLIGIILLIVSLIAFKETIEFIKNGKRATATVIKLEEVSGDDGNTHRPIFSFKTFTNQEIITATILPVHLLHGKLENKQL